MNVVLLGAGASKSYSDSVTKVKMPVARDFFHTFRKLAIAEHRWVLIGDILNYLREHHNKPWLEFLSYSEDIEVLRSEVMERMNHVSSSKLDVIENMLIYKTYLQLIFLFASVINEIQNGKTSITHLNLAKKLTPNDFIITFNWDTLMDRALSESSSWNTDKGYFINPTLIYRDGWIKFDQNATSNATTLLKLHGSTNWLTSYMVPDGKKLKSLQETPTSDFYIYESTVHPYSTYNGRYMNGYSDFSYGYYPVNLPLMGKKIPDDYLLLKLTLTLDGMPKSTAHSEGLVSMPLIIPPVKNKEYSHFGTIFSSLWSKAEEVLIKADRIIIVGYSFPVTDTQTETLFKNAFSKRNIIPEILIVDPKPEQILNRFEDDYGIAKNKITTFPEYFNKDFDIGTLFK